METWLQPCRCFHSRGSPAAGRRQLCSNGAPGCKTVTGVTAPHRPDTQLKLCGSQQHPTTAVGKAQTPVYWLKTFAHFRINWNWDNQIKWVFFYVVFVLNKMWYLMFFKKYHSYSNWLFSWVIVIKKKYTTGYRAVCSFNYFSLFILPVL